MSNMTPPPPQPLTVEENYSCLGDDDSLCSRAGNATKMQHGPTSVCYYHRRDEADFIKLHRVSAAALRERLLCTLLCFFSSTLTSAAVIDTHHMMTASTSAAIQCVRAGVLNSSESADNIIVSPITLLNRRGS